MAEKGDLLFVMWIKYDKIRDFLCKLNAEQGILFDVDKIRCDLWELNGCFDGTINDCQ